MLAMLGTTTAHTARCLSDLPGMRLEHTTRKPVLVEGEQTPVSSRATVLTVWRAV